MKMKTAIATAQLNKLSRKVKKASTQNNKMY